MALHPCHPQPTPPTLRSVADTRFGRGHRWHWRGRAWGGNDFAGTKEPAAVAANEYATFTVTAQAGNRVSFASISKFDYRRSSTGPANGVLQYQIGSGAFNDIAALSYPSNTSSGGSFSPINLTGIPALQNVGPEPTSPSASSMTAVARRHLVCFRRGNSTAPDLVVQGIVSPTNAPDLVISMTHTGNFAQGDAGDSLHHHRHEHWHRSHCRHC